MSNPKPDRHTLKNASNFGLALGATWFGLALPGFDFVLLPILPHRSIITHSLLIPILVSRWLPKSIYAGILMGISIHLWADSLSTTFGFAQVYLPVVKSGVGPQLSFVWLIGNAVVGLVISIRLYRAFPWPALGFYAAIAIAYAILNEGGAFVGYSLSFLGLLMAARSISRRRSRSLIEDSL